MEKKMTQVEELKEENKSLRETCEILSDSDTMKSIEISVKQITQGKFIPLAKL